MLLQVEPLRHQHLDELAAVLAHPSVYEFIEKPTPSAVQLKLGLERALRGPSEANSGVKWLNFLVSEASSRTVLGRLEATVHHGIAEVAFLFAPGFWGKGFATDGLLWLHEQLLSSHGITEYWATTVPENVRCRALLQRCGYHPVSEGPPVLYSYDDGDLVFKHSAA